MPWKSEAANLGFSTGRPWLPAGDTHAALAVDSQEPDRNSMLAFTRDCLALRRSHIALRLGTMDRKIAATALVNDALLLSANRTDFQRGPGLRVENAKVFNATPISSGSHFRSPPGTVTVTFCCHGE